MLFILKVLPFKIKAEKNMLHPQLKSLTLAFHILDMKMLIEISFE